MSDMQEHAKEYAHIRRVVCAAIQAEDGEVLLGIRHYSPDMHRQIRARPDGKKFYSAGNVQQGFVDQWGNFLTREEAWKVAEAQGQILDRVGGDGGVLYSENLY